MGNNFTVYREDLAKVVRTELAKAPKDACPKGYAYIPAGQFLMGRDIDFLTESNARTEYTDAYCISTHETTNAEYKAVVGSHEIHQKIDYYTSNIHICSTTSSLSRGEFDEKNPRLTSIYTHLYNYVNTTKKKEVFKRSPTILWLT